MAVSAKKLIAAAVVLFLFGASPMGSRLPARGLQRSAPPAAAATRIVSLVPNVTEMLFAIGAGRQVVGVSSYDDFPPEAKLLPRVGALIDPDTERILALRPDLVIVYGSQGELEAQLARTGIRVFLYRHSGVDNVLKTIRDVGVMTGHANEADGVVRGLRSQLDGIRARVRGRPRPRTLLVIGRDTGALRGVYASGGIGFLHELLDTAGGEDVFADTKREAVQPSNETMITRAPDVIIELHAGDPPAAPDLQRERAVWNLLASVPAVRKNRVSLLYGGYLVTPGPRLGQAAEALARILHPDAFR
jgi:iron complex transport system substrate-binding protein